MAGNREVTVGGPQVKKLQEMPPLERIFPPGSEGHQIVNKARLTYLDYQLGLIPEADLDKFIDNPDNGGVIGTHDRRLGELSVMGYIKKEMGGLRRPELLKRREIMITSLAEPSDTVISESPKYNRVLAGDFDRSRMSQASRFYPRRKVIDDNKLQIRDAMYGIRRHGEGAVEMETLPPEAPSEQPVK